MATFGTNSSIGVPTAFQFSYDGAVVDWGTTRLLHLNDLSNSADPIDNRRKISDLTVTFADTDAELWGSMGNGTGMFNKDLTCDVFIGGSMGNINGGFEKVSEVGANQFRVHTGKIVEIKRSGRGVTLHSQNMMNLLKDLRWLPPVEDGGLLQNSSGSTSELPFGMYASDLISVAGYGEEKGTYTFKAVISSDTINLANYLGTGIYDTDAGTGIKDFLATSDTYKYSFRDLAFYTEYPIREFKITGASEHIEWVGGTASDYWIYPMQPIQLEGDPVAVLRHLLFGKMVSEYFDQDTHMGTETFDPAHNVIAFQVFSQTFEPSHDTFYGEIEDLIRNENALFYISTTNRFEFEPYGPRNLDDITEEIDGTQIIEASYSNHLDDFYNRFQLKYRWDSDKDSYIDNVGSKFSSWVGTEDRPLELDSKWIQNANQANTVLRRQMARFEKTSPRINFTTTMKYAGMDLGSVLKITDTDTQLDGMIVQLIGYRKGFGAGGETRFDALDGTSLWRQRGYAVWEGDDDLTAAVSGTSLSGWGTLFSQDAGTPFTGVNGTVHNIDTTKYGTTFRFW